MMDSRDSGFEMGDSRKHRLRADSCKDWGDAA